MNWIKRYWGILLVCLLFLLSIPGLAFFTNWILLKNIGIEVAQDNDWLNFWSSIAGGLIGGFITFLGLYITIHHEKTESEKDRMLQVRPFLDFSIGSISTSRKKSGYQLEIPDFSNGIAPHLQNYHSKIITIQNIGFGPAKNLKCELVISNKVDHTIEEISLPKDASLEFLLGFTAPLFNDIPLKELEKYSTPLITFSIIASYDSLLNKSYTQNIHGIYALNRYLIPEFSDDTQVHISKISENAEVTPTILLNTTDVPVILTKTTQS